MIRMHGVIQEMKAMGCWGMAEVLTKFLTEYIDELGYLVAE